MIKKAAYLLILLCHFSFIYNCQDRIFNNPLDPDKVDIGYRIDSIITLAEGLVPIDMTFSGDSLWILDQFSRIYAVNHNSGSIIRRLSITQGSIKGIAYDGSNLWCLDNTQSQIIQINIVNGETLKVMGLPIGDYHSMDYSDNRFYIANHRNSSILVIHRESGENLGNIDYPSLSTDGLATDITYIWTVEASTTRIYRLEKTTPDKQEFFRSPTESPSALCHFQGSIWCGDKTGSVYKLTFY